MKWLILGLVLLIGIGCAEEPTQSPILVQPPIVTEHDLWEVLDETGEVFKVGFYWHVKIEPRQAMYNFEIQVCVYDDDALLGCNKGYAVSIDRADVPFKYLSGEFSLPVISTVDTVMWGYASGPIVDVYRLGRGWFELTYTYYTDDSGLRKKIVNTLQWQNF